MGNIKNFLIQNKRLIFFFVLLYLFFFLRGLVTWILTKINLLTSKDVTKVEQGFLTDKMAKTYADQLYNAMSIFGTDEKVLQSVYMKLQNMPDQVYKVYNAFGSPKYWWFGRTYFLGDEKNLWGWLLSELKSSSQILKNWRELLERGNLL